MTALIFGLGYLGAALAADLLAGGERVVGVDNGFATDWDALETLRARPPGRFELLRGDVRRQADVEAAFDAAMSADTVHLLAAQASAHPDAAPAEYTEDTNLRGPRLVFEAALRRGTGPVVYASSFHVYGAGHRGTVDESRPYGVVRDLSHLSKIYVEKLGEMYALTRRLTVAPVRLGVVYGVGPVVKRDLRFVTVPHAFCLRALSGQPLAIHAAAAAPIGFIHLDDAVAALRAAPVSAGYAPANAVSEVATVSDVARWVAETAAARGRRVEVRDETGGQPPSETGTSKGALPPMPGAGTVEEGFSVSSRLTTAGWAPARALQASIGSIYDYYAARSSA